MRLNKYLTEGSAFFTKTVKKLAKMTDDNDHTRALALGLELLGLDYEAGKARGLATRIERQGGYSPGDPIAKETDKLYRLMMNTAREELSPADYNKFHGAF